MLSFQINYVGYHLIGVSIVFLVYIKCFYIHTCISAKTKSDVDIRSDILDSNILEAWLMAILTRNF